MRMSSSPSPQVISDPSLNIICYCSKAFTLFRRRNNTRYPCCLLLIRSLLLCFSMSVRNTALFWMKNAYHMLGVPCHALVKRHVIGLCDVIFLFLCPSCLEMLLVSILETTMLYINLELTLISFTVRNFLINVNLSRMKTLCCKLNPKKSLCRHM